MVWVYCDVGKGHYKGYIHKIFCDKGRYYGGWIHEIYGEKGVSGSDWDLLERTTRNFVLCLMW